MLTGRCGSHPKTKNYAQKNGVITIRLKFVDILLMYGKRKDENTSGSESIIQKKRLHITNKSERC